MLAEFGHTPKVTISDHQRDDQPEVALELVRLLCEQRDQLLQGAILLCLCRFVEFVSLIDRALASFSTFWALLPLERGRYA